MWKNIFNSQWEYCAVKHKEHAKSGYSLQHKEYNVFYVGDNGRLYSSIMLILRDNLQPIVVQ